MYELVDVAAWITSTHVWPRPSTRPDRRSIRPEVLVVSGAIQPTRRPGFVVVLASPDQMIDMERFLAEIISNIKALRGVDLRGYRRSTLRRRIEARMAKAGTGGPEEYLRRLRADPRECDQLIASIGIKISSFFRNPVVFELLAQDVLPEIIGRNLVRDTREIRAWSAGCAGGEEAYSLAILIHQALKGRLADWTTLIFATDLDGGVLEAAKAAVYSRERLEDVKLGILDKYFAARNDRYEVRPFIRAMVHFSRDDLMSDSLAAPAESIFGTFDLVFCRNVLIYFSPSLQARVFERLYKSLATGGYLLLGDSESLNAEMESKLVTVDRKNRIFRKPPR